MICEKCVHLPICKYCAKNLEEFSLPGEAQSCDMLEGLRMGTTAEIAVKSLHWCLSNKGCTHCPGAEICAVALKKGTRADQ